MTTDQDQTPVAEVARHNLDNAAMAYTAGQQKLVGTSALLSIAASLVQLTEQNAQALDVTREGWAQNAAGTAAAAAASDLILSRLAEQNHKLHLIEKVLQERPLPVERVAQGCGCAPTPAPGYAARCDLCTAQTWIFDPTADLLPDGWTCQRVFYCPDCIPDDEGDEL